MRKQLEGKRGAPFPVKKQFAQDVENLGGIHNVGKDKTTKISEILAERPLIYGRYHNECENLIYYWRRLTDIQYRRVLQRLKVHTADSQGTNHAQNNPATKSRKVHFQTPEENDTASTIKQEEMSAIPPAPP